MEGLKDETMHTICSAHVKQILSGLQTETKCFYLCLLGRDSFFFSCQIGRFSLPLAAFAALLMRSKATDRPSSRNMQHHACIFFTDLPICLSTDIVAGRCCIRYGFQAGWELDKEYVAVYQARLSRRNMCYGEMPLKSNQRHGWALALQSALGERTC